MVAMLPSMVLAAVDPNPAPSTGDAYFLYGSLTIDGNAAPVNTLVSVKKNSVEIASTTVSTAGQYVIENVTGISGGDTLVYEVNNAYTSSQSFVVPANTLFRADLAFTSSTPTPTPSPSSGGGGGGGGAIIIDNDPPTDLDIIINNGAPITDSTSVTLTLSAKDATLMMISNYADFRDGVLENYLTSRQWILTNGEGEKTVYVKYRDQYGNESGMVSDSIIYSTTGEVLGVKVSEDDERAAQLAQIEKDAEATYPGLAGTILANTGQDRNQDEEPGVYDKYTTMLIDGVEGLDAFDIDAITYFILYGTVTTQDLGAGERAGVINSYKAAFGKLPTDYESWLDVIKIANGRWPTERSEVAEAKATATFKTIYLRDPDMDNPNDNAAVTIMAYGLRPDDRNLDSEKTAILTFEKIFGYSPSSATDWDAVRAIAYSGAVRQWKVESIKQKGLN